MLDELLNRGDVKLFIDDLKNNERYFKKNHGSFTNHNIYYSDELALYIFYDALLKFKIIIDDIYLFDDYLDDLEKVYRKMNDYDGIRLGINKVICKTVAKKLNVKDPNESKNTIIKYIYQKFILEGYLAHGFNISYEDYIKEQGFIPEIYKNYYQRFIDVNKIFEKYSSLAINKDFSCNKVYFTDDFVTGCYYSCYSPMFFYKFLFNEELYGKRIRRDAYLIDDYDACISSLKRFMVNASFSDKDKKTVLNLVKDQWDLLHSCGRDISLLLVKRNLIYHDESTSIDDYLKDTSDVFDVVDRLLSSKKNNVYYNEPISSDQIKFVNFKNFYEGFNNIVEKEEKELDKHLVSHDNDFLDKYGNVSIIMLVGSIFISLGVIISIIMFMRGL